MGRAYGVIQPGEMRPFGVHGNYLTVRKSRELLEIELISESETLETHYIQQGSSLLNKRFSSIVVTNQGESASEIEIITGVGQHTPSQDGGRVEVNGGQVAIDTSAGSVPVTMDEGQLNFSISQLAFGDENTSLPRVIIPPNTSAQIAGVNNTRRYLRVTLPSDAAGNITMGGAAVSENSGGLLEIGITEYLQTQAALFAHNPNAEAVTVYAMEVNKL